MLAIYFTQVTPRYSVRPRGGLSAGSRRIRATVRDRGGVPGVSGAAALAGRVSMPALWTGQGVAGTWWPAVALCDVCAPSLGDGRDDLPGHAGPVDHVVSRHLVGDQPEDRCQCLGLAARVGPPKLQDRLGVAAQAPAGDGPSRTGSADGSRRSG